MDSGYLDKIIHYVKEFCDLFIKRFLKISINSFQLLNYLLQLGTLILWPKVLILV